MQKLIPRVGVTALASPPEIGAADQAPKGLAELAELLGRYGVDVVATDEPVTNADASVSAGRLFAEQRVDAVCLAAVSWFEDYLVLDMLEECEAPVLLWPQPGMEAGAMCGTQQLTCCLKQLDKPYASVFGVIEKGDALSRGLSFLRAAALRKRLRRARIGRAGGRVHGMTEVSVNEIALKKSLGPRIVPVDMPGLLERARKADRADASAVWTRLKCAAAKVEVSEEAGLNAASMYLAIKEIVGKEGLSALAFGCYPDYMGRACLAASLLADEGMPIACEGDVNGAVGMLMLTLLTGGPTHNTDWLDSLSDGSVVFTHCGSGSYSLAENREEITLAPVRLANQGVCSLFPARTGPVTLVNLMPAGGRYQMAVMEGEAIPTEMVFPGNPLRVRFAEPVERIVDWIHDQGIGHHWIAGYGHVSADLGSLARIIGSDLRYLAVGARTMPCREKSASGFSAASSCQVRS